MGGKLRVPHPYCWLRQLWWKTLRPGGVPRETPEALGVCVQEAGGYWTEAPTLRDTRPSSTEEVQTTRFLTPGHLGASYIMIQSFFLRKI